jgi:hypothetical protein
VQVDPTTKAAVDPTKPPAGAVATTDYFANTGSHSDFPYSSCRNVVIQITWWEELQNGSQKTLTYDTVIADPAYVFVANLNKGGAINFKPDCGANVSMDADNSLSADISAIVSNTTSVYKAEQTWSSSQKK